MTQRRWQWSSLLLLLCTLPSALCLNPAYPAPRGDPSAKPHAKHALVELVEQSQPLSRPTRDWRHPELKSWLDKGDLAVGMGLAPLQRLHIPVFVNVFTMGLEGNGAAGVNISSQQIAEWMQHLEHVLPQTRLRAGEEHGSDISSSAERTDAEADSDAAHLSYRYHIRLVQLSPKVTRVLERFLAVHYRTDSVVANSFQIDAEVINGMLEGLAKQLQLDDAYNLFVLNPSSSNWLAVPGSISRPVRYGYRSGFSNDELDFMLDSSEDASSTSASAAVAATLKLFLAQWKSNPAASYAKQLEKDLATPQPIPQFLSREEEATMKRAPAPQLELVDEVASSDAWASSVLAAPHFTGPQSLLSYLRQQSQFHPEVLRGALGAGAFANEDCLVDGWVGRGRSLFVDLAAGPGLNWGPVVGGEGIKTETSFPSTKRFARARASEKEMQEDEGEDTYVDASYDADAVAAERIILLDLLAVQCGAAAGDDPSATGGRENSQECQAVEAQLRELAEFESAHMERVRKGTSSASNVAAAAGSNKTAPPLDSVEGLSFFHDETVEEGGSNSGHDASIEADHFLAHLSSTLSASLRHVITPSVAATPPFAIPSRSSSTGAAAVGSAVAGGGGYAEHVSFHLYVLVNHQNYDPLADQFVARLKFGLDQLRLPSQTFSLAVHKLTMEDDPTLAMAYASAMRTSVVSTVSRSGKVSAIKRMYLDSRIIKEALTGMDVNAKADRDPLFGQANRAASAAASASSPSSSSSASSKARPFPSTRTRDISIFLFSVDFPLPVLVDKFFQSQPVPTADMVIAVQSNLRLWESPMSCNNRPMSWNLRDPLRSMLSSLAHVLGGVLPLHLSYSTAHQRTSQDWQWSTGLSPLALTSSQGFEFSQTQKDSLHRNYVTMAIRASTALVNRHLRLLAHQRTTFANRMLSGLDDIPLSAEELARLNATSSSSAVAAAGRFSARTLELQVAYAAFQSLVAEDAVHALEDFQFDRACKLIEKMYKQANDFSSLVRGVIAWNGRDKCSSAAALAEANAASNTSGWSLQLSFHWYLATLVVCSVIVLYRLLVQRHEKPKLN